MVASIEPGTILADTYQITHLIGRGGMGAVWAAKHLRLSGKIVAVKVLSNSRATVQAHRFRREAEIVARLEHPNIVAVFDYNMTPDGQPYMVQELLKGETLAERLKRGKAPLEETLEIAGQVGAALDAAHRNGVVHRDLKPDNIFLCDGDVIRVKVLDFGISKILGETSSLQTDDKVMIGTPRYMSPEQVQSQHQRLDHRSDIYSFAVVLREMLTAERLYEGRSLMEAAMAIVHQPLAAPTAVPDNVARALTRAWSKKAEERFDSVAEFVRELTGVHDSPSPGAPAKLSGVRSRVMAATLAGTVLLVTAGVLFLLTRNPEPRADAAGDTRSPAHSQAARPSPVAAPAPTSAPSVEPEREAPHPSVTKSPREIEKTTRVERPTKASPEPVPLAVQSLLTDAEAALRHGDIDNALLLARRSFAIKKTSAAYALIARAHCRRGDFANARNAFNLSGGSERKAIAEDCRRHGVELD